MRVLPRATMVEQAKEANTGSCSASNTIKHMRPLSLGKVEKALAMDPSIKSSTRRHGRKSRQKLGLPKSVPMSGTQAIADIG
ncbi:hypothetical protein MRX96_018887 [Rhipicephalus microplus]